VIIPFLGNIICTVKQIVQHSGGHLTVISDRHVARDFNKGKVIKGKLKCKTASSNYFAQ
jgi:hypothetical protein